jgi:hypothetical protein
MESGEDHCRMYVLCGVQMLLINREMTNKTQTTHLVNFKLINREMTTKTQITHLVNFKLINREMRTKTRVNFKLITEK